MPPLADRPKKELESLTRRLRTKADKIRALARARVPPADIARFLGIRYQHAYNVMKRSGLSRDEVMDAPARPKQSDKATLDSFGRIAIPEHFRAALGVAAGDELLISLEGEELRVFTRAAGLRVAQSIVGKYLRPGDTLSAELIRDRRREVDDEHG
jgi:bifunctional DNA-binding transcriptional regulator/antitoxin component of YhaV-PrlF toxin-antitoxin module